MIIIFLKTAVPWFLATLEIQLWENICIKRKKCSEGLKSPTYFAHSFISYGFFWCIRKYRYFGNTYVCYSFLFSMFNVSNKNLTLSVSSKIQTFFKLELGYCLIILDISLKFLQLFRTQKQLRMTNLLTKNWDSQFLSKIIF